MFYNKLLRFGCLFLVFAFTFGCFVGIVAWFCFVVGYFVCWMSLLVLCLCYRFCLQCCFCCDNLVIRVTWLLWIVFVVYLGFYAVLFICRCLDGL